MIRVLVTYPNIEGLEGLMEDKDFKVDVKPKPPKEELINLIKDYDSLLVRSEVKVTKDVMDNAEKLKLIGRAGTGVDNIDVTEATKRGIVVMNVPGGNTISAAEHTFAIMLALVRNITKAEPSLRAGKWERSKFVGSELYDKTLGIVGLGRIGREVAKRAIAFGMRVIAYDPFVSVDYAKTIGVELVSFDDVLRESDFLSLHATLTDSTRKMINKEAIEKMKPEAIIINTARGDLIDEEALYDALKNGRIKGAALDVYSVEPPVGSKLLELDNVVLTPHLGASTEEAEVRIARELSKAVVNFFKKGVIVNAVNMPSVDMESFTRMKPYLDLVEKVGKFQSCLIEGGPYEICLTYSGEISDYNISFLTSAFLKGFLSQILDIEVNYINALYLAKERKIKINEIKSTDTKGFTSIFESVVMTDLGRSQVSGTVFASQHIRITEIQGLDVDIRPEGNMLVLTNVDKPGIIGQIGTILGNNQINIASMEVGRKQPGGEAVTVLNIDSPIDDSILQRIKQISGIIKVKAVTF